MKKSILGTLLGMAMIASTHGQGNILFNNYSTPPFSQIYWNPDSNFAPTGQANQAINDSSLQFQLFYGSGVISDAALLAAGQTFNLSDAPDYTGSDPGNGHGPGGYFGTVNQLLPTWSSGDTYTFLYKIISPGYNGQSGLWQETMTTDGQTFGTPELIVSVPEPATYAMAGLAVAAMLIFRRRKA
jgi:hypothetical protein